MEFDIMAGSGFVIYRRFADGIKFLGLLGPDFQRDRCNGDYDIPKGTIDLGETPYQTADREAEEEAGYRITPNMVMGGPWKSGLLTIWMAEVYTDPVLIPNPHTGIVEHEGWQWMDPHDIQATCYDYLKPCLKWAAEEIKKCGGVE